jgi:hemerythrin-like domain-containing protein
MSVHHQIEDEVLFPAVTEGDPALEPVVKKLEQEHEVIADLLCDLDEACVELLGNPARIDRVCQGRAVVAGVVLALRL